jgi:hypothetical protein
VVASLIASVAGLSPEAASAQSGCRYPTTNGWLSAAGRDGDFKAAPAPVSTFPVVDGLPAAIVRLEAKPIEAISAAEAVQMAGPEISQALSQNTGLRPYLVRAVFPTARPSIKVERRGDDLTVFAAGLGCAPFTKHPLVILLDREPRRIAVAANSAL